ncbi:hypothetical protein EAF04_005644 [Stromatinia cepivora]|nr:hypothetical protein EAF04_005644 [Stromatinia cepivora]
MNSNNFPSDSASVFEKQEDFEVNMKGDEIYRDMVEQRRELTAASKAELQTVREGHMGELQAVREDHMRELQAVQAVIQAVRAELQAVREGHMREPQAVRAELQAVQAEPQAVRAELQAVRAEHKRMLVVGGIVIISIGILAIYLVFQWPPNQHYRSKTPLLKKLLTFC